VKLVIIRTILLSVLCALGSLRADAAPIPINFETLAEFDSITTQFADLTFSNATVLTAGSSLNEFELPPHSGANAVFDDAGPLSIAFTTSVYRFSGFFTYFVPLTVTAFDASNNVLATVSSQFGTNLGLSGEPGSLPNELLQLSSSVPIASVSILGDPVGGSFVADDLTVSDVAPVPEPGTLFLMGLGALVLVRHYRRRSCG
jgi:hypothetical protein